MIYYPFKNYEEFKELFGIIEHGNGVKSRKNKILLAFYKDRNALREHIDFKMRESFYATWETLCEKAGSTNRQKREGWLADAANRAWTSYCSCKIATSLPSDMMQLKTRVYNMLEGSGKGCYSLHLNGHDFYSNAYRTDYTDGLCEDGTDNAIRYVNVEKERTFKMKAGKMLNHIFSCCPPVDALPEQVKRWFSEEFVGDWIAYAHEHGCGANFELHVDDNFSDIYDSDRCKGDFHSCMVDDDNWSFYKDAVDAKAAYLTNEDGDIVARCIIYTNVYDMNEDKYLRLAERQYSTDCDDNLKRMLINALYRDNHIDGHKAIGASCSDSRNFVDEQGNSPSSHRFSIDCRLQDGDTMSYQDSFKFFKNCEQTAYNFSEASYDVELTGTDGVFSWNDHEDESWSEYHETWISDNVAVYVEHRDDTFYADECRYCENTDTYEYYEDCIYIDGDYYYAGWNAEEPGNFGLCYCEECGEYFLDDNGCYSELTEEYYCSEECLEEAERRFKKRYWHLSEYDDEYFEDADDIVEAFQWRYWGNRYDFTTISRDSLNELLDDNEATFVDGAYYIDDIGYDGEPVHYAAANFHVA